MVSGEKGFTLFEFLTVCSTVAVLMACFFTGCVANPDKIRESELQDNIFTIKTALDRYASDHNDTYPEYLIGGDARGWNLENGCLAVTEPSEDRRPPIDPLIELGYLGDYPGNPFLGPGGGVQTIIAKTGARLEEGCGDVRFGYDGTAMGNTLSDPRFLFDGPCEPTNLQFTMLPDAGANLGVLRANGPNPFYCVGGIPGTPGETIKTWWPGEFFYRARGTLNISAIEDVRGERHETIWGWPHKAINRYILGGFGSHRIDGEDMIRLTTKRGLIAADNPDALCGFIPEQYYQDHYDTRAPQSHNDIEFKISYSHPEVMGAGRAGLMPTFPYYYYRAGDWLYGAPDGYVDGIIVIYTSAGTYRIFE